MSRLPNGQTKKALFDFIDAITALRNLRSTDLVVYNIKDNAELEPHTSRILFKFNRMKSSPQLVPTMTRY